MKKILKIFFLISIFSIVLVGCGIKNADNIIDSLSKKQEKCDSYYLEGTMEIINNEDTYTYDVTASYKKGDYYKIDLVNTLNNHEQVILRNDDGVYVVTPSLNKSFKFQSDWPYNNSQVYLLNSIIQDLTEDEDRVFKTKDNGYYFKSSVNYPNNKSLVNQNVYVDKNMKITKVEVTDADGKVQITMKFNKIKYNKKFANDYFELSKLINVKEDSTEEKNNTTNESKTDTNSSTTTKENNTTNESSNQTTEENNTTTNDNNENNNTNSNTTNSNSSTNSTTNDSSTNTNNTKTKQTATIDDVVYPMYLPDNTTLANKEVINTDEGQRLILTFSGDNPFVLVEETISYQDEGLVIPVSGSLDFLTDVIGVINDNSVNWDSNGIDYYIVSNTLKTDEILNIARSISVLPVSK
jgi:outer membrane lipoprotein-sorting protein